MCRLCALDASRPRAMSSIYLFVIEKSAADKSWSSCETPNHAVGFESR